MASQQSECASVVESSCKPAPSMRPQLSREHFAGFEDEAAAHRNALTAAERAFTAGYDGFYAQHTMQGLVDGSSVGAAAAAPGLCRRQSIRFAGHAAVPLGSQSIRPSQTSIYRHRETSRSVTPQSYSQGTLDGDSPLKGAKACNNLDGLEIKAGQILPQLRTSNLEHETYQARPTNAAEFTLSAAGRHLRRRSVRSSERLMGDVQAPEPRRRKSLSFLQDLANAMPAANRVKSERPSTLRHDSSIARPTLTSKQSFIFLYRRMTSQHDLRHTTRSNRMSNQKINGFVEEQDVHSKPARSPKFVAKTISQSIRSKLGMVFRKPKASQKKLPLQQMPASRAHFRKPAVSGCTHDALLASSSDVAIVPQVSSCATNNSLGPNPVIRRISDGNLSSTYSDEGPCGGRSRVTSWADSATTTTMGTSLQIQPNRLSIIKEDCSPNHSTKGSSKLAGSQGLTSMAPHRSIAFLHTPNLHAEQTILKPRVCYHDDEFSSSSTYAYDRQDEAVPIDLGDVDLPKQDRHPGGCPDAVHHAQRADLDGSGDTETTSRRAPRFETGSSLFPRDTSIEQERGMSPFRRSRASARGPMSPSSCENQDWPAREAPSPQSVSVTPKSRQCPDSHSPSIYSQSSSKGQNIDAGCNDQLLRDTRDSKGSIFNLPFGAQRIRHLGEQAETPNESEDEDAPMTTNKSPPNFLRPEGHNVTIHSATASSIPLLRAERAALQDITWKVVPGHAPQNRGKPVRAGSIDQEASLSNSHGETSRTLFDIAASQHPKTGEESMNTQLVDIAVSGNHIGRMNEFHQAMANESQQRYTSPQIKPIGIANAGVRMGYLQDANFAMAIDDLPENRRMTHRQTKHDVEGQSDGCFHGMHQAETFSQERCRGQQLAGPAANQSAAFL